MRNTVKSMLKKGTTTFVDFREGGLDGVLLIQKMLSNVPIRAIILGRLEFYQSKNQIKKNLSIPKSYLNQLEPLLKNCDGIGTGKTARNAVKLATKSLDTIRDIRDSGKEKPEIYEII